MRAYLIDWLSELHLKFKLWPETLYVCVGLIDKFIMRAPDIKKKDLQCLGITALHIAGKYEEIYPPELKQILRVTDNAVSKEQVLQLEFQILQTLDFNVTFPSILRFMERYSRIAQTSERTHYLAQYLCDTCLLDCTLMKERPSKLAAVCLYAALRVTKAPGAHANTLIWNATLTKNSGYREEDVRGMAMDLIKFVKNVEQSSLQSLYKKYSGGRYLEAAKLLAQ
jgi:G2/mitotic-specific cyclin-B, other